MMEPAAITALQAWALVPIKAPFLAKTRLSGLLSEAERARLQWAMLQDVLDQLSQAKWLAGIAVVSPDARVRQMAQARGMLAFDDEPRNGGLNAAVQCGTERLRAVGADLIVILPGDVPLLDAAEIDRAIDLALRKDIAVVVPDHAGEGTNALIFWADRAPLFQFGRDSFRRHLRESGAYRATGLPLGSIARDIDCADDLDHLRQRRRDGAAANTSNVLAGFALSEASQPLEENS